jgi:predicted HAD superfamily phosphohydrolase YqeG
MTKISFEDYQLSANSTDDLYECSADFISMDKLNEHNFRMMIFDFDKTSIDYREVINLTAI